MEFLRPSRRRTIISEAAYILLNIAMAAAILVAVGIIQSPLAGFALVLLSKWRIFAVRPQYWYANLVSNMVDIFVSLGFVLFLSQAAGSAVFQIILTVLYIAWLLLLKPQSKRRWVISQAGVGLFVGTAALMSVSYGWWATPVVIVMWVLGYIVARHVLVAYKESHFMLLSFIWGLVVAELGWLFYHWNFAYSIGTGLMISQAAIIITLLGFLAERVYVSIRRHGAVRRSDVLLPSLLTTSSIAVLLVIFNSGGGI